MSNPDYKTIVIQLKSLEISFTPEDFVNENGGDDIKGYQDNKYLIQSAIDIVNDMSYKELGEDISTHIHLYQKDGSLNPDIQIIEGYNDDVEGDIKEIVDKK